MFTLSLVAAAVVAPLVLAQDTNLGLQAIKAHFQQSHLVPDLFSTFAPTALVTLNFSAGVVLQPGQNLSQEQVAPVPTVTVQNGNTTAKYTLAMLDADTVGSKLPDGQTRHWLVNGVYIADSSVFTNASSTEVTAYAGPAPPANSGPHRYVVVLYNQPDSFHAPENLSTTGVPVSPMKWTDYVTSSGLGSLVGATYFTVEAGAHNASIPTTSSVVTQTLVSSSSGSKTSTGPASTGTIKPNGAVTLSTGGHVFAVVFLGVLCIIF